MVCTATGGIVMAATARTGETAGTGRVIRVATGMMETDVRAVDAMGPDATLVRSGIMAAVGPVVPG